VVKASGCGCGAAVTRRRNPDPSAAVVMKVVVGEGLREEGDIKLMDDFNKHSHPKFETDPVCSKT